jgi:hypothetical protein
MPKPKTLAALPYDPTIHLRCSDTELVVSKGLPEMPTEVRDAVLEWLHAHGLSEMECTVGHPIVRDPHRRTVTWTGVRRDANGLRTAHQSVRFVEQAPEDLDPDQVWPAPFPQILLDQPDAEKICRACGRYLPKDRR